MRQLTIADLLSSLEHIKKYQSNYKEIPLVILDRETGKEIPVINISVNRGIVGGLIDMAFTTEQKHIKSE